MDAFVADPRLHEVHPELSFQTMAGRPLRHGKKSWGGQTERRRLLAEAGIELPTFLGAVDAVPPDDVLDAAVVAWSALRIARGHASSFPGSPEQEDRGRLICIRA